MSKVPPGASSSPYGENGNSSYADLARESLKVFDRMYPEMKGKSNNYDQQEVKPKEEHPVEKSVTIIPEKKKTHLDVPMNTIENTMSKETKQILLDLFVSKQIDIVSMSQDKIVVEINQQQLLITLLWVINKYIKYKEFTDGKL